MACCAAGPTAMALQLPTCASSENCSVSRDRTAPLKVKCFPFPRRASRMMTPATSPQLRRASLHLRASITSAATSAGGVLYSLAEEAAADATPAVVITELTSGVGSSQGVLLPQADVVSDVITVTEAASPGDLVLPDGVIPGGATDPIVTIVIPLLFGLAVVGLLVLTGGVVYLAYADWKDKREVEELQKKSAPPPTSAKSKKGASSGSDDDLDSPSKPSKGFGKPTAGKK